MSQPNANPSNSGAWWKFWHVWMVLAGPAIVVVASFVTYYLAASGKDPLIEENYYRKGVEVSKTLAASPDSLVPATQARNHAATGGAKVQK